MHECNPVTKHIRSPPCPSEAPWMAYSTHCVMPICCRAPQARSLKIPNPETISSHDDQSPRRPVSHPFSPPRRSSKLCYIHGCCLVTTACSSFVFIDPVSTWDCASNTVCLTIPPIFTPSLPSTTQSMGCISVSAIVPVSCVTLVPAMSRQVLPRPCPAAARRASQDLSGPLLGDSELSLGEEWEPVVQERSVARILVRMRLSANALGTAGTPARGTCQYFRSPAITISSCFQTT
jgi:hypothetical protein